MGGTELGDGEGEELLTEVAAELSTGCIEGDGVGGSSIKSRNK